MMLRASIKPNYFPHLLLLRPSHLQHGSAFSCLQGPKIINPSGVYPPNGFILFETRVTAEKNLIDQARTKNANFFQPVFPLIITNISNPALNSEPYLFSFIL